MVQPPAQLYFAREVVAVLGGLAGVEHLTGAKRPSIHNWMAQNRFPSHYYVVMRDALALRGMTAHHRLWRQEGNHKFIDEQRRARARIGA